MNDNDNVQANSPEVSCLKEQSGQTIGFVLFGKGKIDPQ